MQKSYDELKEGRKHLRNAQDFTKEESYALRDELKKNTEGVTISPVHVLSVLPPCLTERTVIL